MTPTIATVAARIAGRVWGGRWTAEQSPDTRQSGLDRTRDSRDEDEHAQPSP